MDKPRSNCRGCNIIYFTSYLNDKSFCPGCIKDQEKRKKIGMTVCQTCHTATSSNFVKTNGVCLHCSSKRPIQNAPVDQNLIADEHDVDHGYDPDFVIDEEGRVFEDEIPDDEENLDAYAIDVTGFVLSDKEKARRRKLEHMADALLAVQIQDPEQAKFDAIRMRYSFPTRKLSAEFKPASDNYIYVLSVVFGYSATDLKLLRLTMREAQLWIRDENKLNQTR